VKQKRRASADFLVDMTVPLKVVSECCIPTTFLADFGIAWVTFWSMRMHPGAEATRLYEPNQSRPVDKPRRRASPARKQKGRSGKRCGLEERGVPM
jgi:hypothetical protein